MKYFKQDSQKYSRRYIFILFNNIITLHIVINQLRKNHLNQRVNSLILEAQSMICTMAISPNTLTLVTPHSAWHASTHL